MDVETLKLKGQFQALLAAYEDQVKQTGIRCNTKDCVFNGLLDCNIRLVILQNGECPHYNPKLTFADVLPGLLPDTVQKDRKE